MTPQPFAALRQITSHRPYHFWIWPTARDLHRNLTLRAELVDVEGIDATASGLTLDPLSHRASQLPADLIDEARKVLDTRGAPYLNRSGDPALRGA